MDVWQERLRSARIWAAQEAAVPTLRLGLRCGKRLLAGGLLAGAALNGQPLFLAVGYVAACGGGVLGLAALMGTILGGIAFWGALGTLEQATAALLAFCIRFVLRDLSISRSRWMPPVTAMGATALLGLTALWAGSMEPTQLLLIALRMALAGLAAAPLSPTVELHLGLGALVWGAARLPLVAGMSTGGLIAVFWASNAALNRRQASSAALTGAAAMCLAGSSYYLLPLGMACLSAQAIPQSESRTRMPFRAVLFLLTALTATLLQGVPAAPLTLELILGTLLGAIAPQSLLRTPQTQTVGRQLQLAADGLRALDRCSGSSATDTPVNTAVLFDRTAEQVCRVCAGFSSCWEQNSAQTIAALECLSPKLLAQGHICRDELIKSLSRCRRPNAFSSALNHQLDLRLCRHQGEVRLEALRNALFRRNTMVAGLLEALAAPETTPPAPRYRAVMGAAAAARSGEIISGDAGSYCKGPDGRVYLLVCDGMGTGAEAARLSHAAVDALSALLQAGTSPEDALAMLGDAYLLRGDGAFSTVDLAAADLHSGEVTLYKWGAAPSYLLTDAGVKRVGTATLPPGLGADEALAAETVRLSLERGELLVLISDGAGGTETERLLGAYDGCAPRELADRVVRAAQNRTAVDDMTAAVLRLERMR